MRNVLLALVPVFVLYACANSGSLIEDEEDAAPVETDAGTDSSTKRYDSGTSSSSSSSSGAVDAGSTSSSSSSSSSSSGNTGNLARECTSDESVAFGAMILAAGSDSELSTLGITKVNSCSECRDPNGTDACCATYNLFPQGKYCIDMGAIAGP